MIQVVEGKGVGSGKSYMVIEMLMQHWRRGGTAYASDSFNVVWPACQKLAADRHGLILEDSQFHSVKGEDVARLHEVTPPGSEDCPVLIVLDEAQDQLNARDWNDTSKRGLFQWACQSRHDDNDLVFVSQSAANIDKQIRRLATFTWSIRNSRNFSIPGIGNVASNIRLFTLGLNDGFYFIRNQLDYDGRTVLERKWVKADKQLFKCYTSKSMRMARKRLGVPVGKKQLARVKGRSSMIKWFCICGLGVAVLAGVSLFRKGIFNEKVAAKSAPGKAAPAGPSAAISGGTAAPAYEIRKEAFLGSSGGTLVTNAGEYRKGEVCAAGMVEAVQGDSVRIRTPAGALLYVVADRRLIPRVAAPAPTPTATPRTEIIYAPHAPPEGITENGPNK